MPNNNVNPESSTNHELIHITPDRIAFDLTLSLHDLRVYMVISSFTYTTGDAYASNNWIAKKLNVDRSTVIRSINRLCEKKYIVREEIKGHRYLRIVINSMRHEGSGGVAHVRRGGRSRATQLILRSLIQRI